MKIFVNNRKKFPTPFHYYQEYAIRDFGQVLDDISSGDIPTNIGKPFDVNFPIDKGLNDDMINGMSNQWDK